MSFFESLDAHWKMLSGLLALALSWLGRSKGASLWTKVSAQFDLNTQLTNCREENDRLMEAMRRLGEAGSLVAKAVEEGRLRNSSPGSPPLPPVFTGSPPNHKQGPLDLPWDSHPNNKSGR